MRAVMVGVVSSLLLAAGVAAADTPLQLVSDAEAAAKQAKWAKAFNLGEQAVDAPGASAVVLVRGHAVAALAGCQLKDPDRARKHWKKLPTGPRKKAILDRCKALGVTL